MNNVVRFKILCYLSDIIRNLQCKCVLPKMSNKTYYLQTRYQLKTYYLKIGYTNCSATEFNKQKALNYVDQTKRHVSNIN